jgi:hypothetical protein
MGQGVIVADSNSQTARKGPRQNEIERYADHIIETYKPFDAPILLMWREIHNSFHLSLNADYPTWVREDERVHKEWKRCGPEIIKILKRRSTIVKVNRRIRDHVKHGHAPDRSGKRTDEFYRGCIPSSIWPAFGMVIFPRGAQQDHPLILESRKRRASGAATGLTNAIDGVRAANDLGNLSDPIRDEIISETEERTVKAFRDDRYPLLKDIDPGNSETGIESSAPSLETSDQQRSGA